MEYEYCKQGRPTANYGVNQQIDEVVRRIVARGNDAEVRSSKDGIKIFEVSKRVAAVIPKEIN